MTAQELWQMSTADFNEWRNNHDLPRLKNYIKETFGITDIEQIRSGQNSRDLMAFAPYLREQALKLGETSVSITQLDGRDLDFVDLDGLVVTGRQAGATIRISHSSCKRMSFQNVEKGKLSFRGCWVNELKVENSRFRELKFISSNIHFPTFINSRLSGMVFDHTYPRVLDIQNCEIIGLKLVRLPKGLPSLERADLYKRLRVAYQQRGNREDASKCFYQERWYGLLDSIWKLRPRAFLGLVDWAMWGFGERPRRILLWTCLAVAFFTGVLYFSSEPKLHGNFVESAICSGLNYVTVGCNVGGEVTLFRELKVLEGGLGMILTGLLISGFSNKTRY
jgi:hypothetical protein